MIDGRRRARRSGEDRFQRRELRDPRREMGPGFVEPVYQECLEIELARRGIPIEAKAELNLVYKGEVLKQQYEPDIICYGKILLEL